MNGPDAGADVHSDWIRTLTTGDASLIYEVRDRVARLTLNRPQALNSFNSDLADTMLLALRDIHRRKSIRAVLLRAAGRGFCTGQDLKQRHADLQRGPVDLADSLERGFNRLVMALHSLPRPVVCAVNGYASGAGVGLVLASDVVVAARSARFDLSFARLGLVPDAGTSQLLAQKVGAGRARAMILLGESVDAATAESWGMVWRCVEDADLDNEAERLVQRLAAMPGDGPGLSKSLLAMPAESLGDRLKREAEMQRLAGRHADYREAIEAFVAKREPLFKSD